MSLASLEITPHSLQHTRAVVSTPASWLFLEKAFLGMSAWLGLMPNMFVSQVSWQDCERSLRWSLCAPGQGCEQPSYRRLPCGSEPRPQHGGGQQLPVGFPWTCCLMQRQLKEPSDGGGGVGRVPRHNFLGSSAPSHFLWALASLGVALLTIPTPPLPF